MSNKVFYLNIFRWCLLLTLYTANTATADIQEGEKIYQAICFTCHGKDLEGGTGHNLKDSVWLYGGEPETILANIKKGFPEKGMMAFGSIYSEAQLKSVVEYIQSKQEGLRNVSYRITHQLPEDKNTDLFNLKADKQGMLKPALIDITLPEVDSFVMTFKGDLLITEPGNYQFKGSLRGDPVLQFKIDGKPIPIQVKRGRSFNHNIKLNAGTHSFEAAYIKHSEYFYFDVSLQKKGKSPIALSADAYKAISNQKHIVSASDGPTILRKRINQLPSKTIAIAFPEKINTSIYPIDASINGLWLGEFLDIAPNINRRGNQPSINLAEYLFAGSNGIKLKMNQQQPDIKFLKYSTLGQPEFYFTANQTPLSIQISAQGSALHLKYQLPDNKTPLSLELPEGVKVQSQDGKIEDQQFIVNRDKLSSFSLLISSNQ